MTNRDQRRPNCPVCGTYTAARNRRRRQNCEPFCTMRCAAQYGRGQFSEDPYGIWDVESRSWVGLEFLAEGSTYKHVYISENGWERREPKRWHTREEVKQNTTKANAE